MVVDTSAMVAYLRGEPEADRILARIEASGQCIMSAMNVFEARTVLNSRFGIGAAGDVDDFLHRIGFVVLPFDEGQAQAAFDAYRRFGKGSGSPARLNLADCAAYALARTLGMPLLFKGDDFTHTDVPPALA